MHNRKQPIALSALLSHCVLVDLVCTALASIIYNPFTLFSFTSFSLQLALPLSRSTVTYQQHSIIFLRYRHQKPRVPLGSSFIIFNTAAVLLKLTLFEIETSVVNLIFAPSLILSCFHDIPHLGLCLDRFLNLSLCFYYFSVENKFN